MATDLYVYIFYQYNGKRPPEDGSTAKSRHPELMKYNSDSGQCWLRPSFGLDIHATKRKKQQTLLGFELQVTWPSPVTVPIKLPLPFLWHTVLILFVIDVDKYVNHLSETVYAQKSPFHTCVTIYFQPIFIQCCLVFIYWQKRRNSNSTGRLLQMKVCTYCDRLKINANRQALRVTTSSVECLLS